MNFEVKRSIVIDKPVEDVWKILWDESTNAFEGVWNILSNVKACNEAFSEGDVTVDGISGRELAMMDGSTYTEMLEKVDKENHILSYSIAGAPFGLTPVATWTVSKSSSGDDTKSEVVLVEKATLSYWPPQFLAYPVFSLQLPGVFDAMLSDVKHFAETGVASPAKVEAAKKTPETK